MLTLVSFGLMMYSVVSFELHAKKPIDEDYPLPLVPFNLLCVNGTDTKECGTDTFYRSTVMVKSMGDPPRSYDKALRESPYRTTDDTEAVLSFVCCFSGVGLGLDTSNFVSKLAKRSKNKPYVIWIERPHRWVYSQELTSREDVIFFGYDMRDYALGDHDAPRFPGFTILPPLKISFLIQKCPSEKKYYLSFKGKNNSGLHGTSAIRGNLQTAWESYKADKTKNIYFKLTGKNDNSGNTGPSFLELMNTTFALAPRGHFRWSFRFGEILQRSAIPVVMSDGWVLPFSDLIDWTKGAVVLEESLAEQGFDKIVERLSKIDAHKIQAMQDYICHVLPKYLSTFDILAKTLIAAAMRAAEKERGANFVGKTL
eukprot:m.13125 g.13125  ORF g.13125 m.13125 type:complete len:369 (+) comp4794_c0_seq1:218-1324(+)